MKHVWIGLAFLLWIITLITGTVSNTFQGIGIFIYISMSIILLGLLWLLRTVNNIAMKRLPLMIFVLLTMFILINASRAFALTDTIIHMTLALTFSVAMHFMSTAWDM